MSEEHTIIKPTRKTYFLIAGDDLPVSCGYTEVDQQLETKRSIVLTETSKARMVDLAEANGFPGLTEDHFTGEYEIKKMLEEK